MKKLKNINEILLNKVFELENELLETKLDSIIHTNVYEEISRYNYLLNKYNVISGQYCHLNKKYSDLLKTFDDTFNAKNEIINILKKNISDQDEIIKTQNLIIKEFKPTLKGLFKKWFKL